MKIQKAVITAAGPGQSALPLQRLVDRDGTEKTALEMIIEEVDSAGIDSIAIVISPGNEDAYEKVISDKSEFLDESNYDLTTAEFFVRNFFEIKFNLNKVEKLIHNNPPLQKIKQKFPI